MDDHAKTEILADKREKRFIGVLEGKSFRLPKKKNSTMTHL